MGRIVFRADAGKEAGYGHFVRCLALASMLKDNFYCVFYTAEPGEWQRKEASGVCPLVTLPYGMDCFSAFLDSLREGDTVVLDNYFYDTSHHDAIRSRGCRLVCIDDLHEQEFHADLLLCPCTGKPEKAKAPEYCKVVSGPGLALLRAPFLAAAKAHASIVKGTEATSAETASCRRRIYISFGGSDPCSLTLRFAKMLSRKFPEYGIDAVVGNGFAEEDEKLLPACVKVQRNVSAEEIAGLLSGAAFAVCPASGSCYEALACGCPVYAGYYADNQKAFYGMLSERGLISPLGFLPECHDLPAAFGQTPPPAPDAGSLFSGIAQRYRSLFRGLQFEILNYAGLSPEESRQVWELRNRPEIRCLMCNPEPIPFDSHERFISSLKERPDRIYLAFFEQGKLVGTYNFTDIHDGSAGRGLIVSPEYQGSGAALAMESIADGIISRRGVRRLDACVRKGNPRSAAYHIKAGYSPSGEDGEYYYYSRSL